MLLYLFNFFFHICCLENGQHITLMLNIRFLFLFVFSLLLFLQTINAQVSDTLKLSADPELEAPVLTSPELDEKEGAFHVKYIIDDLSEDINNVSIELIVTGGEYPYIYKWSDRNVSLTSNVARCQTEGMTTKVSVIDSKNDTVHLQIEIPASSSAEKINAWFKPLVAKTIKVLFWDPFAAMKIYDPVIYDKSDQPILHPNGDLRMRSIPIIVIWLVVGAIFFTIKMRFINIVGFKHAIDLTRGIFDKPGEVGEVSHFQALATALSGTVGLGNIAGVAIAIATGGPGATLWMIIAGLFGMTTKFVECTLGVKYRNIDAKGEVSGGPMYYLTKGLKKRNLGGLGKVLAAFFALLLIGGSFSGGSMFQANQAFAQLKVISPVVENYSVYFGVILAIIVGVVIIGGIKNIARFTDKIVPLMAFLYVGTALVIIIMNIRHTPEAFGLIFWGAFNPAALKGGIIGVLIVGFQRAAFSNEAGIGSASIAHSAVKTNEPITEGFVAILEPFIDTVVICTMTALVLIFTGLYTNPDSLEGAALTSAAFGSVFPWFPYILIVAIFLFAFSTMISWSYYGVKGFDYLLGSTFNKWFGSRKVAANVYRFFFLTCVVVGAASSLGSVVDFTDMMILSLAFPNILGLYIMSGEVRNDLKSYMKRLKSGEIKRYK